MQLIALIPLLIYVPAADDLRPLDPFEAALVASMLHFSAEGDVDYVKPIVEKYPHLINRCEQIPQPTKPSRTDTFAALHFAAENGEEEVVAYLLSKGANMNQTAGLDWTPLHLAAADGHLDVVKMLVKAGANTKAKTAPVKGYFGVAPSSSPDAKPMQFPDIPSFTPLEIAKDRKQAEVVKFLETVK